MNSGLAFWGPFLVIFGAALIISVVQRYARDICLMSSNPALGWSERLGVLEEYSDKFILIRDAALVEEFPAGALRKGDARDRFAVILPRSNSFVRHLARRPGSHIPAVNKDA